MVVAVTVAVTIRVSNVVAAGLHVGAESAGRLGEALYVGFDVGHQGIHGGLHALDDWLRIDAHTHDQDQERSQHQALPEPQVGDGGVVTLRRPVEHPLVSPQKVESSQDHPTGGRHGPPPVGVESTHQD